MAALTMRMGKPFRRIKGWRVQAHDGDGGLPAGGGSVQTRSRIPYFHNCSKKKTASREHLKIHMMRRTRKSDQAVAKLSYGGGGRRIDMRSWMLRGERVFRST